MPKIDISSKSTFPDKDRESIKRDMNDVIVRVCKEAGSTSVLVLDDPLSFRTSRALAQKAPSVVNIIVPNDVVIRSTSLVFGAVPVAVFATKLGGLLSENPFLRFDAAILDFCGQFKTCEAEIKQALQQLKIGPRGSPFLTTLNYTRGGDSPSATRSKIENMFADLKLVGELVSMPMTMNGMVTHFWIVKNE